MNNVNPKIIFIIGVILAIIGIIFELVVLNKYANIPADEVPFWVWWFFFSGN